MQVRGQVCWVSGAAQGIGLELCKLLAGAGGDVVMVDLCDEARGQAAAREVQAMGGGRAAFVRADVSRGDELRAALERPQALFGGPATIVCGNAGIVVKDDDARAETMLLVNSVAVISGTTIAAELIKQAGKKGVIVNTASLAGLTPVVNTPAYAASKWAVVGHTLSLGFLRKTHGVRVNCICPALVSTPAVGEFFKEEFNKAGGRVKALAAQALDARKVAGTFMRIIDDDALNASAVVVMPQKVFVHNPRFEAVLGQAFSDKVPDYLAGAKL